MRLMQLAERFRLPVVTLVDTVGAWPTFECEGDGVSEAIATNLTVMAGLKVPIVTIVTGEGGSGGAIGIGMGNIVGMLSGGYFGVISPEGAASILGRYKDEADKARQFPLDCQELAKAQCIYADQVRRCQHPRHHRHCRARRCCLTLHSSDPRAMLYP
jgi:acetyl-CoA carboxylase alpha subunit